MKTQLAFITFLVAMAGTEAMYGGKTTTIEKHHHLASVVIDGFPFCAATIISRGWVVAPLQCVYGLEPASVTIVVGSEDGITGTQFNVSRMVTHPSFSVENNYLDYNYVCVRVDGLFEWSTKVKPASLPSKRPVDNFELHVVGYGLKNAEGGVSKVVKAGRMKWQSGEVCKATVAKLFPPVPVTNRLSCAYNQGKTTLCLGDWGVALIYYGVFYGQYVANVALGYCSENAEPGVFADIFAVADWIKSVTGAKFDYEF